MHMSDYEKFAVIIGRSLAVALVNGGEDMRERIYYSLYNPTVKLFAADNPNFSMTKFSWAVGNEERDAIEIIRGMKSDAERDAYIDATS